MLLSRLQRDNTGRGIRNETTGTNTKAHEIIRNRRDNLFLTSSFRAMHLPLVYAFTRYAILMWSSFPRPEEIGSHTLYKTTTIKQVMLMAKTVLLTMAGSKEASVCGCRCWLLLLKPSEVSERKLVASCCNKRLNARDPIFTHLIAFPGFRPQLPRTGF